MTVGELREIIAEYPADMPVMTRAFDTGVCDVDSVSLYAVKLNVREGIGDEGPHEIFSHSGALYLSKPPPATVAALVI